MIQFSNDKIRRSWQGKKFMPSMVKGVKSVNTAFAKYYQLETRLLVQ